MAGLGIRPVEPGGDLGRDLDPGITGGKTIVSMLPAWQTAITEHARPTATRSAASEPGGHHRAAGARARRAPGCPAGHVFVAGYVILLGAFGIVPTAYGIYFAFTKAGNYFAGLSNFTAAARDFRYLPAVEHIGLYLVIWLVALVVFVTGLALVLHQLPVRRLGRTVRFLYYIPGALAGAASVMVWLFMLDPTVSPAASFLRLLGYGTFGQVIQPGHLAILFAMIAFWTGGGGWIVVMYGALNNIPLDIIEAARIDGAGAWPSPGASRSRCCASGSCTW